MNPPLDPDLLRAATVLSAALGCGLLVGIERERRKGQGDDRDVAGVRSFAVAAVCGALAQSLPVPHRLKVGEGIDHCRLHCGGGTNRS